MHRFRKKSETRRQFNPELSGVLTTTEVHNDIVPSLPPASDFRTSLILPGLTRRFTLLRSYTGDPVAIEDLKSKFAEQRARGGVNQVSEEEEDMILEALGRMRFHGGTNRNNTNTNSQSSYSDPLSPPIDPSSTTTSPSKPTKRFSNNLFGSARLRDYNYVRSTQRTGSTRSALSFTPSEASTSTQKRDKDGLLQPRTPEDSSFALSMVSNPNEPAVHDSTPVAHAAPLDGDGNSSGSEFRLSRTFNQETFKRASMALEEVIREIEEEAEEPDVDDDIVLLRSPAATAHSEEPQSSQEEGSESVDDAEYAFTGTALSSDEQIQPEEFQRDSTTPPTPGMYSLSRNASPTPRVPGYIPGMQRPMTPRDAGFESDDQSTTATTPRAVSPRLPGISGSIVVPSSPPSRVVRRDSNASTAKQVSRTNTPMAASPPPFFSRPVNGRFTPEDRQNGDAQETNLDRHGSRRRPISPLSSQTYQPLTSSSPIPSSSSRPGTPSANAAWRQHGQNQSTSSSRPSHIRNGSGHSRNGSVNSLTDVTSSDMHGYAAIESAFQRTKSSESARSAALPDSPTIDSGRSSYNVFAAQQQQPPLDYNRSPSVISGMDLGSPFSFTRVMRSQTPNDNGGYNSGSASRAKSPALSEYSPEKPTTTNGSAKAKHSPNDSSSSVSGFTLSLGSSSQPLVLSPLVNSSRSSLESEGSSYHSWDDEAGKPKDRVRALFAKVEPEPPEWHEFRVDDALNGFGPFGREVEVVRQLSGLSKSDFVTIQEKLIDAVTTSKTYDGAGARERVDRAGSALRKRRPSTSQSNYSVGPSASRVASPVPVVNTAPPATIAAAVVPPSITTEHPQQGNVQSSKANALLDSVIDSIQSPAKSKPAVVVSVPKPDPSTSPSSSRTRTTSEVSSPTRRNRKLADALFGPVDQDGVPQPLPLASIAPLGMTRERSAHDNMSTPHLPQPPLSPSTNTGRLPQGQMSSPNLTVHDRNDLTLEVQRKVDAATIALRKSPSNPKFPDTGTVSRKKINREQISSPTLVSATTSVDTIPLPSPSINSNASSGKFSLRMKKLRGTLRSKPNGLPTGDEVTPFPLDIRPSPVQTPSIHQSQPMDSPPGPPSATELGGYKIQVTTPPATSGPGLKGFMARFRKNKNADSSSLLDAGASSSSKRGEMPHSSGSSMSFSPTPPGDSSPSKLDQQQHPHSAPTSKVSFGGRRSVSMRSAKRPELQVQKQKQKMTQSMSVPNTFVQPPPAHEEDDYENDTTIKDEAALKQLFDAASNLGLDQAALNSLVARSTSTSSKSTTGWRSRTSLVPSRKSRPPDISEDTQESLRAPSVSEGRPSMESFSQRVTGPVIRKLSIKKNPVRQQQPPEPVAPLNLAQQSTAQPRQQTSREEKTAAGSSRNTIIRRTIIMPSETKGVPIDINTLLRKNSTATTATRKRRSASAASIHSNRSIQDRAPTPPPPKSAGASGRRFSTDAASPPVPHLPQSFSNLEVPNHLEKPSSTYDSLYDMYSGGDSRVPSTVPMEVQGDYDGLHPSESGPALEVIEMANGETIWSIVNGLRDDDAESFYGNRASFASEYSLKESNSEGVQVYFKDHGRPSSKGSASSFISRKKQPVQSANRPETKVFFSSSAHIGRLIENLSKGLDSGSFNILPNRPQSHATTPSVGSESDMRWTVEERLESMLGSMETHS